MDRYSSSSDSEGDPSKPSFRKPKKLEKSPSEILQGFRNRDLYKENKGPSHNPEQSSTSDISRPQEIPGKVRQNSSITMYELLKEQNSREEVNRTIIEYISIQEDIQSTPENKRDPFARLHKLEEISDVIYSYITTATKLHEDMSKVLDNPSEDQVVKNLEKNIRRMKKNKGVIEKKHNLILDERPNDKNATLERFNLQKDFKSQIKASTDFKEEIDKYLSDHEEAKKALEVDDKMIFRDLYGNFSIIQAYSLTADQYLQGDTQTLKNTITKLSEKIDRLIEQYTDIQDKIIEREELEFSNKKFNLLFNFGKVFQPVKLQTLKRSSQAAGM